MAQRLRRQRVTVIDDSPELLALFGDVLRADGVDVSLFNGSATVSDLEQSAPDLIIVDLHLAAEGLAGIDIVRLCRSHRALRSVPIIVCSAAIDELQQHEEELSRTAHLFVLAKPFSMTELESCLDEALGTTNATALDSAPARVRDVGVPLVPAPVLGQLRHLVQSPAENRNSRK